MAKPTLALIPAAQGSKFYSVLPSNGVGDFDFTRSGSATRINKDGLIETVLSGVSRLNYPLVDGVVNGCPHHILEPSRTNVLQRSEEFDNAYWINNGVTINANQTISPSGQLNADLLTGVSGGFGVVRFSTWSATNKVASCFAKKGSTNLFKIANVSSSNRYVLFDLSNGTVSEESVGWTGFIENYGNGWYRCTAISNNETGTFSLGVTAASESVYIWGAQLESDYKTSYIPTTTAAVTRSAETANGSGNAATFNDSEGVLMAEISALTDIGSNQSIAISDGSISNRILFRYNSTNQIRVIVISNTSTNFVFDKTLNISSIKEYNKFAIKYKQDDFALWVNGFELGADNSGVTPTGLNELALDDGSGINDFYGNIKQIQYFDTALTDQELQTLTTI